MPKHDFGIMPSPPSLGEEFVDYAPAQYHCLAVEDDDLAAVVQPLREVRCYWHSLSRSERGLARWGITLIPPEALPAFIEVVCREKRLDALTALLRQAERENRFVIHFGI